MDIQLRPFRDDDLPFLYAQQADPEAAAMAGFPSRDEEAYRAHWDRVRADGTNVIAVVEVDGHVAGNIGSWLDDGRRLVGYWFGKRYWGRGIATEALRAFLLTTDDRPLYAYVAIHNRGSMRVLEKNGFVELEKDADEILYELR